MQQLQNVIISQLLSQTGSVEGGNKVREKRKCRLLKYLSVICFSTAIAG